MESWLLLVTNLPGRNQTLRMRLWRALKAAGAVSLRDGVYLLPDSRESKQAFDLQAASIQAARGTVHVLAFGSASPVQQARLRALFDRGAEYAEILARCRAFRQKLAKLGAAEARRGLEALRRDTAQVIATDFFRGPARLQAEAALKDAEESFRLRMSPDESRAAHRTIRHLARAEYRGRLWGTRCRPWIDRVCSAWLIRRFIDPKARFLWLKDARKCPANAVGFDFENAEFTHVGNRVTFEVLAVSFGLDEPGLARLAALVHYLDVGGVPVPEAAGLAAVVSGARAIEPDDDALLRRVMPVLDSLYATFSAEARQ